MQYMNERVDVAIVGAGPVGLLTAIELSLGGARVLVLERLADLSMVTKALGIGPLGSEALQRRGMASAIAAAEERTFAAMAKSPEQSAPNVRGRGSKFSGHFAGLSLIRKDAQKEPQRRARPVDQQAVEGMLADRARSLGIEINRGCEVTGVVQREDDVDVQWVSAKGEGGSRWS
jgi:2-polyprenyl-6-methoxyphenol hydroxylase-like FAD-dependent oxidoreductase